MSKGFVAVQIAGQEYKIRSDSEDESLRKIAGYVDRAMKRVREGTGTVDSLDVAVLTCLNLAREILALREKSSGAIDDARLRALIEKVEAITLIESAGGGEARSETKAPTTRSAPPTPTADAADRAPVESEASVRTLELPSAESLRDSTRDGSTGTQTSASAAAETQAGHGGLPEQRLAAGGRDRAS